MKNLEESTFESWAVVELFGHTKIAGLCSEQVIAGSAMLRIDVPELTTPGEVNNQIPAFTRFLNNNAIYAINPVSEEIARHVARNIRSKPIQVYEIADLPRLNSHTELFDEDDL